MYQKNYKKEQSKKTLSDTIHSGIEKAGEKTKEGLKKTTGEALIFAILGLGAGGWIGHTHETGREKIPLGFSEIEVVERKAQKRGEILGPINIHQMKTNDLCMKIFEAYNESLNANDKTLKFAGNLYDAIDYRNIYKYNLKDLLQQVPEYYPAILEELTPYLETLSNTKQANIAFKNAWKEKHHDNYHTETKTRTVYDSEGDATVEVYTEQVYDDTDHHFIYNKEEGEKGSKILNKQYQKIPQLQLTEKIFTTDETNADGEYAAEKSRGTIFKKMTQEELLIAANSRKEGSTILNNIEEIKILYPKLEKEKGEWNLAKTTAKTTQYTTESRSDPGPIEFQISKNVLTTGKELEKNLEEIHTVISESAIKLPLLKEKIKNFINQGYIYKYSTSKKKQKKLSKEIMQLTKEIYKLNFKKGLEVERYRWRVLVLGFILGGALGVGVGIGIDHITNQFQFYDRMYFKK